MARAVFKSALHPKGGRGEGSNEIFSFRKPFQPLLSIYLKISLPTGTTQFLHCFHLKCEGETEVIAWDNC